MKVYNFSVQLDVRSFDSLDLNTDRLYEAGCYDCIICETKEGVFLDFARTANSMREAKASAKTDVEKAKYKVLRYVD